MGEVNKVSQAILPAVNRRLCVFDWHENNSVQLFVRRASRLKTGSPTTAELLLARRSPGTPSSRRATHLVSVDRARERKSHARMRLKTEGHFVTPGSPGRGFPSTVPLSCVPSCRIWREPC